MAVLLLTWRCSCKLKTFSFAKNATSKFVFLKNAEAEVISAKSEVIFNKPCQRNLFQELQFQDNDNTIQRK